LSALLSRGEYEKKYSKDDRKNDGEKEKERGKAMGKIPLRGKKGFALAPIDSLF
jgi:hypothetical protein